MIPVRIEQKKKGKRKRKERKKISTRIMAAIVSSSQSRSVGFDRYMIICPSKPSLPKIDTSINQIVSHQSFT